MVSVRTNSSGRSDEHGFLLNRSSLGSAAMARESRFRGLDCGLDCWSRQCQCLNVVRALRPAWGAAGGSEC